jgi:hypothetical protein
VVIKFPPSPTHDPSPPPPRNDAFDFNVALEDAKKEREAEKEPQIKLPDLPAKDYSIKEGEKIRVNIKSKIVSGHGGKFSWTVHL